MNSREQEESEVAAELRAAGIEVTSIYDLVNAPKSYPEAIPILLHLLGEKKWDAAIQEGIVRALTVKHARGVAARPLIEFFRSLTVEEEALKWVAANALAVIANDSVIDDIIELVRDKRHGKAREMMALALCNMKDPRAIDVLVELLDDEEVVGHALMALRKLRATRDLHKIERLTSHPKRWIAKEAKRILARASDDHGRS